MYLFIFSKNITPRLARHLAFWGMYFVCTIFLYLPPIGAWAQAGPQEYKDGFIEALLFWPVYLLTVYSTIYFILPNYLRRRNGPVAVIYGLLLLVVSIPSGFYITKAMFMTRGYHSDTLDTLSLALHKCMANLISITGAAVIIKIMKDYFFQQKENQILAVENIRNRLHLLKMQMHPRILFASLHRISEEIDAGTRRAPDMILRLSDLLSYLLYESESDRVALSMEIKMIENYIALKRLEYQDRIDIQFVTVGQPGDHTIAPGLFLPLLEIGIERPEGMGRKTSIAIELRSAGAKICFSLHNDMPGMEVVQEPAVQTAFSNVKKRLQSSYFKRFKLEIESTTDSLSISLQLGKDKSGVRDRIIKKAKNLTDGDA